MKTFFFTIGIALLSCAAWLNSSIITYGYDTPAVEIISLFAGLAFFAGIATAIEDWKDK